MNIVVEASPSALPSTLWLYGHHGGTAASRLLPGFDASVGCHFCYA
jgi:hypothetical protein